MTLNQLIEQLQELQGEGHGDSDVMFSYNYGDHWRTTVAATVDAAEPTMVAYSDYHQMHRVLAVGDEDEPQDTPRGAREVIVIS